MKRTRTFIPASILFLLLSFTSKAQSVEMAEGFRSEGKIYVVITIAFFVLAVMSFYLISIDRRVRKMENRQK